MHHHHTNHGCNHSGSHSIGNSDARLTGAAGINILLTIVQIVGGLMSGSLALIAEGVHNFSDAATMLIALAAQKIARRKPDEKRTYGYRKVETLSAFTNFLSLIAISVWLVIEAITRFLSEESIHAQTIIGISSLAVLVNVATVFLIYRDSKKSMNIKAAVLHNMMDVLSSVGVILGGILILVYGWNWVDPLITIFISAYILWHVAHDLPAVVNILIDGAPEHLHLEKIIAEIEGISGVEGLHHLHIRRLDEHRSAMEAHVVAAKDSDIDTLRNQIRVILEHYHITHSSLEIEFEDCGHKDCA